MANILIAWELGANLGHIARCAKVADAMAARGHHVVLALRNTAAARVHLSKHRFVQAPLPVQARPHGLLCSFAEMLLDQGYGNSDALFGLTRSWIELLRLVSADLIIADHAPTAMFAGYCIGIPHVAVGNGFAIPPSLFPAPSFRPGRPVPPERLLRASEVLHTQMAEVGQSLGSSVPATLSSLFSGNALIDSFPELDHYGARDDVPYIGPIVNLGTARRVRWMGRHAKRVLAYLPPNLPDPDPLLTALSRLDAEVMIASPGLRASVAKRFAGESVRVALVPVQLDSLLAQADLMVSCGGSSSVTQGLLNGVPQLIAPQHMEQGLLADRVQALGAGARLLTAPDPEPMVAAMSEALEDRRLRESAAAFQSKYSGFQPQSPLDLLAAKVEELLSMSQSTKVLQ